MSVPEVICTSPHTHLQRNLEVIRSFNRLLHDFCQAACEHLLGLLYRGIAHKVVHCEQGSLGEGSTDLLVMSLVPKAEIVSGQRRNNKNKFSSVQNPVGGDASQICSGPGG